MAGHALKYAKRVFGIPDFKYNFYEYYSRISFSSPIFYVFWNDNKSNMGLRTDHIVKILQLEGVGRKGLVYSKCCQLVCKPEIIN